MTLIPPPAAYSSLSNSKLALYALPAIPLAALTLPLYSFIPVFYAESLGLSLTSLGVALFLVRLFDAVNDPVIGWLTDRFRPAFGRRRSWFACSVPLVMLGVWKLFWPPTDATVAYVGIWTLVLSVGYSCAILPYTAWGAELQISYSDRSRVAGWREGLTLIGTLVAITIPFSLGWEDAGVFHGFALLAVVIVCTLPVLAAITIFTIPRTNGAQPHTREPPHRTNPYLGQPTFPSACVCIFPEWVRKLHRGDIVPALLRTTVGLGGITGDVYLYLFSKRHCRSATLDTACGADIEAPGLVHCDDIRRHRLFAGSVFTHWLGICIRRHLRAFRLGTGRRFDPTRCHSG